MTSVCIPFSLWTAHGPEASVLAKAELPHLRAWLNQAQRVAVDQAVPKAPWLATLSLPHERAWAQEAGWTVEDGCMPWAAMAAAKLGLSGSGWAFITLCNWHVSNGQVTLGDPDQLQIDAATDATLFDTMRDFFAEDGIVLHRYQAGQWLAQSPLLVNLPTASIDRVMGRNIDPWLVGGHNATHDLSPAAKLLRRLQNEMQMLLYTHAVNEGRKLAINSFWVHGTGELPPAAAQAAPTWVTTLRQSALQQDFVGWLEAWQHVDAEVIAPLLTHAATSEPQRLVLCGEHACHVYARATPSLWQRLRMHLSPPSLDTVLAVAPLKD
ncbi:MAG: phosphoglycerate mutase [Limnohabitans sp.]|nr:phosphoglycerate mutase [Limnohabitans sp.]